MNENNNGIIVDQRTFARDTITVLKMLESDPVQKEQVRRAQYLWAKEQTWDKRVEEQWLPLLEC